MIGCTRLNLRGDNHELLEGKSATSVGTTKVSLTCSDKGHMIESLPAVEDVHEGNGKDIGLLGSGKVRDVGVQRNALLSSTSLGNSQGNTEDGVGTELGLVGSTIELVEESINSGLVLDINVLLDQSRSNDSVDVLNSLGNTLTTPLGLVAISELASLVLT